MKVPRCKGSRDLLPQDLARFRHIEGVFRGCCQRWGYEEVRTPTLEYLHLFTATGTLSPSMLGRVFSFLDWDGWSGERVVLRPDGTIPAARLYVEHFQEQPVAKLFYVENMFAFEGTGQESRERWQGGVELIGCARPEGDAELVLLGLEVLEKLGIGPVEVRLSHAGLIKAFLRELGLGETERAEMFERIMEGNAKALEEMERRSAGLEGPLRLLFGLKGVSRGYLENLRSILCQLPALKPSLDDLVAVADLLDSAGLSYQINMASGRGFEYYTGAIFQFYSGGVRLGGGGRYDELVPLVGGRKVAASGFALYLDRLMDLVEPPGQAKEARVLIKRAAGGDFGVCLKVARRLREAGAIAEIDPGYGDTANFRWVVVAGKGKPLSLEDRATGKRLRRASLEAIVKQVEGAACEPS